MTISLVLQYAIVALAVLVSAGFVARRQFPDTLRRLRILLAVPMLRAERPAWLRGLGRRIAPPVRGAEGVCGGCHGCGPGESRRR